MGNLFAQLYQAPALRNAARDRFYEQALAAYTQALQAGEQGLLPDTALAAVHYRLAALYRKRAVATDGSVDGAYVALMVAEAEKALPATPQGPTRMELQSWIAQGLQHQLRAARLQENWPQALLLTERLSRLPADIVDPATLEAERRTLILHEVLQQLQEGNQDAALSLIGAEALAEETLPLPQYRTLFANWQITVTLDQTGMSILALARPIPQRRVDAEGALNNLLNSWAASGAADIAVNDEAGGFLIQLDQLGHRKTTATGPEYAPEFGLDSSAQCLLDHGTRDTAGFKTLVAADNADGRCRLSTDRGSLAQPGGIVGKRGCRR